VTERKKANGDHFALHNSMASRIIGRKADSSSLPARLHRIPRWIRAGSTDATSFSFESALSVLRTLEVTVYLW